MSDQYASASSKARVTVGLMTCSTGKSAYFGKVIAHGVQLGLAELRASRSDLDLRVELRDDEGDEQKAQSALLSLVDGGASVIIGPCESHTACAIVELAAGAGIPLISPSATASVLTEQNNPWFFRATPSDAQKVERLARLIALRHPHGALLVIHESAQDSQNTTVLCGESMARDIRKVFSAFGQLFTLLPYDRTLDDTALRDSITRSLHRRAFVGLVILGRSSDSLRISQVVRDLYGRCPIYLVSPGKEMFVQARMEHVFAVTDTVVETVTDIAIERFRARYNNEFPGAARQQAIDQYATFGYDTARIVGEAIISAVARGWSDVAAEQRIALRRAIAETPTDRSGLMSDGGFSKQNELLSRPHVQYLVNRKWEQLSFDEAMTSEIYEGGERWNRIRGVVRKAIYSFETAEKNLAVRILNLIGYVSAGILAILAAIHFIF